MRGWVGAEAPLEALDRASVTIAPPPLEPYLAGPTRLPGLRPMTGGWTQVLADHAAQLALRDRLVAGRRDAVIAMLDEGRAPAGELLSLLSAEGDRGGAFPRVERPEALRRADGALVPVHRADPMATVARLVAEDFCLLTRRDGEAEYRLVAAALCFPSRWSLAEKLGRPMTAIHDPVPDYDADLARRVARVFDALAPARPVERANWLIHADAALHQPVGRAWDGRDTYFLRTERQTLRRLPVSGAVAFGIRTSVTPFEALAPASAATLAERLAALDASVMAYRTGDVAMGRVIDRLRVLAGRGGDASGATAGVAGALGAS